MSRPLRIEYPGALYHITSRGNAGNKIFEDDNDRKDFFKIIGFVITRFHWVCHAYCFMDNHYHLIIETPEGNLSKGMRQLNGIYTQKYNWRHKKTGHLLQGRYKAILIERDSYLLELCRYVVLNPVRAHMREKPEDWKWSSYLSTMGITGVPEYLTVDWILGQFGNSRKRAQKLYRIFVMEGITKEAPWKNLKGQIFLGEKEFIEKSKPLITRRDGITEIPRFQRYADRPTLSQLLNDAIQQGRNQRNRAISDAHITYGYTLKEIANYLKMHYTTISKVIKNGNGKN